MSELRRNLATKKKGASSRTDRARQPEENVRFLRDIKAYP